MNRRQLVTLLCVCVASALGCDATADHDSGIVCADCGHDGGPPFDAGTDAGGMDADTMSDAGGARDAAVPSSDAAEGTPCSFNRECSAAQRCECDVSGNCACMAGARGTGRNGVDTCADGNECASSLCVEGADGSFYCSDECATDADCAGALPRCLDIAFLGSICARIPPDAGP